MYELVKKEDVLTEINKSVLYAVDIPTQRVINCGDMAIKALSHFINKPETMFFKEVNNE